MSVTTQTIAVIIAAIIIIPLLVIMEIKDRKPSGKDTIKFNVKPGDRE